jgi:hypothetical protein
MSRTVRAFAASSARQACARFDGAPLASAQIRRSALDAPVLQPLVHCFRSVNGADLSLVAGSGTEQVRDLRREARLLLPVGPLVRLLGAQLTLERVKPSWVRLAFRMNLPAGVEIAAVASRQLLAMMTRGVDHHQSASVWPILTEDDLLSGV